MPALRAAVAQAYGMAKIDGAPVADSVRLQCPSSLAFESALAALKVRRDVAHPVEDPASAPPAYHAHVAGLCAMAMAARDIRGHEHGRGSRLGIGASLHGFAGQGAVVAVFGSGTERGS